MTLQKSFLETFSPEHLKKFELFAEILQQENKRLNLTRITETCEIRSKHFEDSLVALPLLKEVEVNSNTSCSLVDIGSGAGFPSLALAIALPHWSIVSIEATGKKADFQLKVAAELDLSNVEVYKGRAEDLGNEFDFRQSFDVATSRALGNLALIAELAMPLVKVGGRFIAWKGPKLIEELEMGSKALKILGSGKITQIPYALPAQDPDQSNYRLLEVIKEKNTPGQYPRPFKDIKAKPLGS